MYLPSRKVILRCLVGSTTTIDTLLRLKANSDTSVPGVLIDSCVPVCYPAGSDLMNYNIHDFASSYE